MADTSAVVSDDEDEGEEGEEREEGEEGEDRENDKDSRATEVGADEQAPDQEMTDAPVITGGAQPSAGRA